MDKRRSHSPYLGVARSEPIGSTPVARVAPALRAIVSLGLLLVGSAVTLRGQTTSALPTTTAISGSPNPATITPPATTSVVTLTATVTTSSGPVDAGAVTFVDFSTTLGSSTVSNGKATLTASLAEGTHEIVANYGGTTSGTLFGPSNATFDLRIDTVTTNPIAGSGAGPYTYCNTGAISVPGLGANGPAAPYPSNIFVTNLPGTVNAITVTLEGFTTKDQSDLLSLLVGPGGNNLDFFSLTGSNVTTAPSPFNLVFADTAASFIPEGPSGNLSSAGTFKSTSYNTNITYPQCPPNATECGLARVGPPLPSNPFTPTNKAPTVGTAILGNANEAGVFGGTSSSTYNGNGTWSLFLNDGSPNGSGETTNLSGGWCVNLTENLPSVSATKSHSDSFTQGQQGVPFTVNITNNGPGATGDPTGGRNPLIVTDTLNSAFTYAGFSGTGWACSAAGQTVRCDNDSTVAEGSSYGALAIDVNVSPTASTTTAIPNLITVTGGGATPKTSNTDSVTILPAAVLAIQKNHTGTFTQGQTAQWNITVSNGATSGLTYGTITVSDSLPTGYTLESHTSTANEWACSGASVVTCATTAGISSGASSTITLTVNVPANSPESVTNTALAWGGGDLIHSSLSSAASALDSVTVVQTPAVVTINNGGGTQSTAVGTAFATPLSVTVKDANSVVVPSYPVTFVANPGGAGQSGTFSNSTGTIVVPTNSSGVANAGIFTANSKPGSYTVTVTAGSASTTFNLTNTANGVQTTVVSYNVLFGAQSFNLLSSSRNHLPWEITGIQVVFSQPITTATVNSLGGVTTTSLSGLGTNTLTWTTSPIAIGSFSTVLLASGPNAIKDVNGNALNGGTSFNQSFKVLWGDFNDDGVVSASDSVLVNAARSSPYNIFADMNGDGVVNVTDVNIVRSRIGRSQP